MTKLNNFYEQNKYKILKKITIILIVTFTFNSFGKESIENIIDYCPKSQCTKPIKQLKVGKFYFKARNCETRDYRKCQIWFGTPKNKFTANWVKFYRIINGPIPLNLPCHNGQPIWYSDLPFPEKSTKNFEGIETFKNLNYQNKEKIYYNFPSTNYFNYFSLKDKSFGILINKRNSKGLYKNQIYIFDIKTEKMVKLDTDCN